MGVISYIPSSYCFFNNQNFDLDYGKNWSWINPKVNTSIYIDHLRALL